MRAQLHQRDQEIAILVKMVQKEKAKNAAGGGGGATAPPGGMGMAPPLQQASSPPRGGYGLPPKAASPIQVHGHDSGAGLSSTSGFGSTSGSSVGDSRASASTPAGSVIGVGSGGGRVGGGVGGMLASFSVPTEVLLDRKAALDAFKRNYPKQQVRQAPYDRVCVWRVRAAVHGPKTTSPWLTGADCVCRGRVYTWATDRGGEPGCDEAEDHGGQAAGVGRERLAQAHPVSEGHHRASARGEGGSCACPGCCSH